MKQKLLFTIVNLFIGCFTANSQSFILYSDKTFGGNYSERGSYIINTGNNQLLLSGSSDTYLNGDKTDPLCDSIDVGDAWALKIDTSYNILWNKSLGGSGNDISYRVLETGTNDELIFACESQSDSSCEKSENNRSFPSSSWDYWIYMTDSNGNKIWDKTLGADSGAESYTQIIRLSSGDIIVAGNSNGPVNGDKTVANYGLFDYWLVKLNASGTKLWDNVYGGTGTETGTLTNEPVTFSILSGTGTDFILAGTTNSPLSGDISDTSRGGNDIWIIKLDSAGNKIWDKRYGGALSDKVAHIQHTDDNGYILCGTTQSPQGFDVSEPSRGGLDVWVIKLDSLGSKQWDKRYGGNGSDVGSWIEKAPGGGYWVSGSTNSDSIFEVSEPSYGFYDYWIFKIDSSGAKLWDKRFGSWNFDYGSNFVIMPDSSIFFCGYASYGASAVKSDSGKGGSDYWLVHFKYTDNTISIDENANQNNLISIYPNPVKGKFILNTNSTEKAEIFMYDAMSKEVYNKKDIFLNRYEIDISGFDKGVYLLKVKDGDNNFVKKVVKL